MQEENGSSNGHASSRPSAVPAPSLVDVDPTADASSRRLSYADWKAAEAQHKQQQQRSSATEGLRAHFKRLFPDRRTRFAFVLTLLAALGVAAYWSYYTVSTKWIEAIRHPTQVVTYETMQYLPALVGSIALIYFESYTPRSLTPYRKVLPSFANYNGYIVNKYLDCTEMHEWYDVAFCQPTDINGRRLFSPLASDDLSGQSAFDVDLSAEAWPLQFESLTDNLCLSAFLYFNTTAMPDQYFTVPVLGAVPLTAVQTLRVSEFKEANITESRDPTLFHLVNMFPSPAVVMYTQNHQFIFSATKHVDVYGRSEYTYEWGTRSDLPVSPVAMTASKEDYINNGTGSLTAEEQAELRLLDADPDLTFYMNTVCVGPASFNVRVITDVQTYGVLSFLADAGGFLNILSLAFLLLFPMVRKASEPRSFLVLWLLQKMRKPKTDNDDEGSSGTVAEPSKQQPHAAPSKSAASTELHQRHAAPVAAADSSHVQLMEQQSVPSDMQQL